MTPVSLYHLYKQALNKKNHMVRNYFKGCDQFASKDNDAKLPDMPDRDQFHSGCPMPPCSTRLDAPMLNSSPRREFPSWNFLLLLTSSLTVPKVNKKLCWLWQNSVFFFSGKSTHCWALGWVYKHNRGGKFTHEVTDAIQHIYTWKCILYPIHWPNINTHHCCVTSDIASLINLNPTEVLRHRPFNHTTG